MTDSFNTTSLKEVPPAERVEILSFLLDEAKKEMVDTCVKSEPESECETVTVDDDDDDDDDDFDDKKGDTFNIYVMNTTSPRGYRSYTEPCKELTLSTLNIPGGNDIGRQFYQILDAFEVVFMSRNFWMGDTSVMRALVNRMALLWKRQRCERMCVEEGIMPNVTVDTYFGFAIPHWMPKKDDGPSVYRRWVGELLNNLSP